MEEFDRESSKLLLADFALLESTKETVVDGAVLVYEALHLALKCNYVSPPPVVIWSTVLPSLVSLGVLIRPLSSKSIRLSSCRILAFSFSVDSGILLELETQFSRPVMVWLRFDSIWERIRS